MFKFVETSKGTFLSPWLSYEYQARFAATMNHDTKFRWTEHVFDVSISLAGLNDYPKNIRSKYMPITRLIKESLMYCKRLLS